MTIQLILTIDIGSSSLRCCVYRFHPAASANVNTELQVMEGCGSSCVFRSVQPNTGRINLVDIDGKTIFDKIDECVDDTLENLRSRMSTPFDIVGVGFSCFVMNLVGVDEDGRIVGQEASLSYACNTPEVADECCLLRR